MAYIRHRDRMIQEAVYEDLRNTLIACRWLAGTTSRPVRSPSTPITFNNVTGEYTYPPMTIITTEESAVLPLLKKKPISLIDYFPEVDGKASRAERTPENTFALDTGQAQDATDAEMGSSAVEQEYIFSMAFYATSDAVALAVLNDLRDRYQGKIVNRMGIDLYDYNEDEEQVVATLSIEAFRYARPDEQILPYEVHLYFAELTVLDYVEL